MAWVCEFFTKNPNLKYNIFGGWGRGGGAGVVWLGLVNCFLESIQI